MTLLSLFLIVLAIVLLLVIIQYSPFDARAKSILQIGIVVILLIVILLSSPTIRGASVP